MGNPNRKSVNKTEERNVGTRIGSKKQKEEMWEPESEVNKAEERDVGAQIGGKKTEGRDVGT
jgi:hypothetical protein